MLTGEKILGYIASALIATTAMFLGPADQRALEEARLVFRAYETKLTYRHQPQRIMPLAIVLGEIAEDLRDVKTTFDI